MNRMIRRISIVLAATLLVIGSANAVESEKPKEPEPAAAVVNGKRIARSVLEAQVQAAIRWNPALRAEGNMAALRKARMDILNNLIDEELVLQEGRKAGLEPRDIEIDTEFAKVRQRFPSEDSFQQILKQEKLTEEKLRKVIERALIAKKVLDTKIKPTAKPVTDEDIAGFYEENKKQFVERETVKASHILIKVAPDADDQEKASAKSEIQAILGKARGGEDFAELAKQYSQGPSAPQGGDLGYFARGEMENRDKDQQLYLFADRTRSDTLRGNELLQVALAGVELARTQCHIIRFKLLQIGTHMTVSVRRDVIYV